MLWQRKKSAFRFPEHLGKAAPLVLPLTDDEKTLHCLREGDCTGFPSAFEFPSPSATAYQRFFIICQGWRAVIFYSV